MGNPAEYKVRLNSKSKAFEEIKVKCIKNYKKTEEFFKTIQELVTYNADISMIKTQTFRVSSQTIDNASEISSDMPSRIYSPRTTIQKQSFLSDPIITKTVAYLSSIKDISYFEIESDRYYRIDASSQNIKNEILQESKNNSIAKISTEECKYLPKNDF